MNVRIFIESSLKGPAKRDGVVMWLVEFIKDDAPITRQGFVHVATGTDTEGTLKAMINAFHILKKPCSCSVFTECDTILNTIHNFWHIQWMKNDWHNAKGKEIKHKELWEMLLDKASPHTYTVQNDHHDYKNFMHGEVERELEKWRNREC